MILWKPSPERVAKAELSAFMAEVAERHGQRFEDYGALWRWSVEQPEQFWPAMWHFGGVIGEPGDPVVVDADRMPGAQWFPNGRLNFAENLLRRRDDGLAIVAWGENKVQRTLTYSELRQQVAQLARALRAAGIGPGDRVAALLPNIPEAIVAMLAASSLGAIWSSCSPDFGVEGVLDRFGQIEPRILFATDGYYYAGKVHMSIERLRSIQERLPTVEHLVLTPYINDRVDLDLPKCLALSDFVRGHDSAPFAFERFPFNHPLYILYSSGTTGVPKCIVHGAGGTLLQHLKEHRLHSDIHPDDRVFYFTTCGWMMWNWLVTALASEAAIVLYDGSPFFPRPRILWDLVEREAITFFGTSAKYLDAARKHGLEPAQTHQIEPLRTIASTGSPLLPEAFDYVYGKIKADVCLSSISGGTDIISCFVLGNPIEPVRRGEIQARGLGMSVEVFDDSGKSVVGEKGELVCTRSFPSMPLGFWNDPDGSRYRAAYFERFPGVWCHGDYVELTPSGGMIIFGRSDAVLNPGGVRIGTAEIYRQVEKLPEVQESLVVGQEFDQDVRIVLFVRLREGAVLDQQLIDRIRRQIRESNSPRHVPAKIIQVPDIPRTKSGKITELAVRDVIHGRPVKNREALANPEALDAFFDLSELKS